MILGFHKIVIQKYFSITSYILSFETSLHISSLKASLCMHKEYGGVSLQLQQLYEEKDFYGC